MIVRKLAEWSEIEVRRGWHGAAGTVATALLLLCLAGCGVSSSSSSSSSSFSLAVGWRGPLPSWEGPCDIATLRPAGIIVDGHDGLTAVKPGRATVKCLDGGLALDVRQATALVITPSSISGRGASYLDVDALDANGPLSVGNAEVRWTIGLPLHEMHPCNHGFCAAPSGVRVMADTPGTATVSVEAVGLTATARVIVE